MGTSKSYGGPSDANRLLPTWSFPEQGDGGAADGGDGIPPADQSPPPSLPSGGLIGAVPTLPVALPPHLAHRPWAAAKGSLSRALRASGSRRDYRSAAKAYVRAQGGARRAAQTSVVARGATARLAGFLSSIPSGGAAAAVQALGLASLAGRPIDALLATITNVLAPDGATHEEAAVRRAIAETLAALYDTWGVGAGGLERLQAMSPDDVRAAIKESVSACIFYRWALELGLAIERKAVSQAEAIAMEREMRQHIRDTLVLDLASTDVLAVDWGGDEGERVMDRVYQDAYTLIETAI